MLKTDDYKRYSIADPEMRCFIKAMDYLEIPIRNQANTLNSIIKVLKRFDLLDSWETKKYSDFMKTPSAGKAWIVVVIVAQQIKRNDLRV